MKRQILLFAASLASTLSATAEITTYDLNTSKLHLFQTEDAMGDVSFIIEGEKGLVILEQPLFWDDITEFQKYTESLNKPIVKVIANYHSLGLADYPSSKVVMPEKMVEFCASDAFKGLHAKFSQGFGEAADMRIAKRAKGFEVPSIQDWAGVEMSFTPGVASDFPAASILIDNSAYYTHFSPSVAHMSNMQIKSRDAVDQILAELGQIKASGVEYIFGSHGAPATMADVEFQIDYLQTIKEKLKDSPNGDIFAQQMIVAYPTLAAAENLRDVAKNLYPDVIDSEESAAIRKRVQDYFDMVSNLDETIADGLWAKRDDISIITPKMQFWGKESIMNDFLKSTFSSLTYRKLSSLSEVVNIYGNSANVQLYWKFDTKDADGVAHQTRGRETLVFAKIEGQWMLTHVHYSRMPQ